MKGTYNSYNRLSYFFFFKFNEIDLNILNYDKYFP